MIIFSTIGGTTGKIAKRIAARIGNPVCLDARRALAMSPVRDEDCIVLLCPTYGDGELEDDFEALLLQWDWSALKGMSFAFCEVGIYTGYEDFGHGLAAPVRRMLAAHGLHEWVPPLSVDAVPITDWQMVDVWADMIVLPRERRDE